MKLVLVNEGGTVVDVYEAVEEMDLSKPFAQADVLAWLREAVEAEKQAKPATPKQ